MLLSHVAAAIVLAAASVLGGPLPKFFFETVDGEVDVGRSASLVVEGAGRPHVGYLDVTNRSVKYARRMGTGWVIEAVAPAYVDRNCSIALIDTLPVLLYVTPPIGLSTTVTTATRADVGWRFDLHGAVFSLGGCIATGGDGNLHAGVLAAEPAHTAGCGPWFEYGVYVLYQTRLSSAWTWRNLEGRCESVLPTDPDCSIDVDRRGQAHLVLWNHPSRTLRYFRAQGTDWVEETIGRGTWGSIAVDAEDVPHVAFCDREAHVLGYGIREGGIWSVTPVESGVDIAYCSLAFGPDGTAHLAYYDASSGDLRYARRRLADSGWTVGVIDASGDVGSWASLDVDSRGDVHIAYYDATHGDLRYATTRPPVAVRPTTWGSVKSIYRR